MLTFAEVGKRLGVSGHTVRKMVDAGVLHAFAPEPGMARRVWESDLDEFRSKTCAKNQEVSTDL